MSLQIKYPQQRSIILTNKTSNATSSNQLTLKFPMPITLSNEELALGYLAVYYSWFNITAAYANNSCAYEWVDGVQYQVNFPDGFYSIADISGYIQLVMFNNGHYLLDDNDSPVYYINLAANSTYYRTTLSCTAVPSSLPTNWTNPASITLNGKVPMLQITNQLFGNLIGFNNGSYPNTLGTVSLSTNGQFIPTISKTTAINVACSVVNTGSFNVYTDTIYSFSPDVEFGSQILISPNPFIFYPVNEGTYSSITLSFYDQDRNPLQIVDPNMTATLILRKRS